MEVTFHLKRSDLGSYYDYFIRETSDGKKYAKSVLNSQLIIIISFFIILLLMPGARETQDGLKVWLGLLIITMLLYFGYHKFNPRFYATKRKFIGQERQFAQNYWMLLERTRIAKISGEWLEIITADSIYRVHWNMVERVAVKSDYIFLFVGTFYIIPRRDFPTEENYQEFGKKLMEYWDDGKNNPISTDIISNGRKK
jgi:hypothetical protein